MAVAIDVVPAIGRPGEVATVLAEAIELRDKHHAAQQALAVAQQELERQEKADVAAAAERIRSGEAPGNLSTGITKQRHAVELAQRNAAALGLAVDAAQADLASTISTSGSGWLKQLERETEDERGHAIEAIDQFERAAHAIQAAASAASWIRSGLTDGHWNHRPSPPSAMLVGGLALSSRRRTANSEPLTTAELVGFLREAIEPLGWVEASTTAA
jgi:hypothetical protein